MNQSFPVSTRFMSTKRLGKSTVGVSVADTLIGRFADAGEAALWKLRWEGQIPHFAYAG